MINRRCCWSIHSDDLMLCCTDPTGDDADDLLLNKVLLLLPGRADDLLLNVVMDLVALGAGDGWATRSSRGDEEPGGGVEQGRQGGA